MKPTHNQLPLNIRLRDDATFENYIGDAARRLAGAQGIVYLWGEPGSGRSHLLQAACHEACAAGRSCIYLCEMNRHSPESVRDLERLSLICLDDVHCVLGVEAWETALFHLVNAVRDRRGTLILSGVMPASRLPALLEDLKSRILAASAVETDVLDDRRKLTLLKQRAASQGLDLGDDVGRFIMRRSSRNLGSLIALLDALEVETLRRQQKITIPLVKQVLDW